MADIISREFEPLREMERKWNAASFPWVPASLSMIYHADAVFFGGRTEHYCGRDRIKSYFETYNEMFNAASLRLVRQTFVPIEDNAVSYQGFGEFDFHLNDGRVTHATLRTSLVLKNDPADGWIILLHHFSPIPERPPVPT